MNEQGLIYARKQDAGRNSSSYGPARRMRQDASLNRTYPLMRHDMSQAEAASMLELLEQLRTKVDAIRQVSHQQSMTPIAPILIQLQRFVTTLNMKPSRTHDMTLSLQKPIDRIQHDNGFDRDMYAALQQMLEELNQFAVLRWKLKNPVSAVIDATQRVLFQMGVKMELSMYVMNVQSGPQGVTGPTGPSGPTGMTGEASASSV